MKIYGFEREETSTAGPGYRVIATLQEQVTRRISIVM